MSPTEKMKKVNEEHGTLLDSLIAEACAIAQGEQALDSAAHRMMSIATKIAEPVAALAICKSGCSHCCKQAVLITEWEAQQIAQVTGRKIQQPPEHDVMNLAKEVPALQKKYAGVACPFLSAETGECEAYESRPYVCRSHYSLMEDAELCSIEKFPGGGIAMFNNSTMDFAYSFLFVSRGVPFADIHEYFNQEQS